jgi:hypothetical protein
MNKALVKEESKKCSLLIKRKMRDDLDGTFDGVPVDVVQECIRKRKLKGSNNAN